MLRSKININGFVIEVEANDARELSGLIQTLQAISAPVPRQAKVRTEDITHRAKRNRRRSGVLPWTAHDIQLIGEVVAIGSTKKDGTYMQKFIDPAIAAIRESGDHRSRGLNSIRQKTQEVVSYLVTHTNQQITKKTIAALNKKPIVPKEAPYTKTSFLSLA